MQARVLKTVAGEDPGLSRGELIAPLELYSLELNPWSARVRGDFFRSVTTREVGRRI